MVGRSQPARVEVEGDRELRRALKHFDGNLGDLRDVHESAGEVVEREAERLVPVRSGLLRQSIRLSVRLAGRKAQGTSVIAGGGRLVPYAPPIHFGWKRRGIEPNPFLFDALDKRREEVRDRYDDGVQSLVRRLDHEMPKLR